MECCKRVDLVNFPGKVCLFNETQILVSYKCVLTEAVDIIFLEAAVNNVLERAEYFRTRFEWKDEELYAIETEQHCTIYGKEETPRIPEDTNGYLFYVQTFDNLIFFHWDHVLTDARGFTSFIVEILECYLNKKNNFSYEKKIWTQMDEYNVSFSVNVNDYHRDFQHERKTHRENFTNERRYVLSLNRENWIQASIMRGVRPFALLIALFYETCRQCFGNGFKSFGFPADMRKWLDLDGIPCNCMTFSDLCYEDNAEQSFEDIIREVGKLVEEELEKERLLESYATNEKWMRDILKTSKKMSVKKRTLQMGSELSQLSSDFWVSYIGDFLHDAKGWLADYVLSTEIWVSHRKTPLFAECISLNENLNICLTNRTSKDIYLILKNLIEYLEIKIF